MTTKGWLDHNSNSYKKEKEETVQWRALWISKNYIKNVWSRFYEKIAILQGYAQCGNFKIRIWNSGLKRSHSFLYLLYFNAFFVVVKLADCREKEQSFCSGIFEIESYNENSPASQMLVVVFKNCHESQKKPLNLQNSHKSIKGQTPKLLHE